MKKNYHYLDSLKEIAEKNGGKLLTNTWEGVSFLYEFELSDGQQFKASYYTISKRWPKLEDNRFKTESMFLKEMNDIAVSRGGKLLSKKWINYNYKYDFIDGNGIQFSLQIGSLRRGVWTPNRGLVSEPICKQIMEHLFGYKFIKTRKVLTKELCKNKVPLELDGYCKNLNIAFEYQGHPSHWDTNYKLYNEIHERDVLKIEICIKLGIILIIVPKFENQKDIWIEKNVLNHIEKAILLSYKENNYSMPILNKEKFNIDFKKINSTRESLKEIKELTEINNGKLLTKKWHGNDFKYKFQFDTGEIFFRTAKNMKRAGWPKDKERYLKKYAILER